MSLFSKFESSGLKKQILVPFLTKKPPNFEKFSSNFSQKNSDRTIQQPSSVFRDKIVNATYLSKIDENLVKIDENLVEKVNKNS